MDGQKVSQEWKENFRMPQDSFEELCIKLKPYIQKKKGFRDPISVAKQVATTLYYLADKGKMRKVANSFSIGKSTLSKINKRVFFLLIFLTFSFKASFH